ncbi:MAG TPA: low affinity iron permease family protein [Xanthomonadaceae bacterium]|nr:low affinity iron permease family protein [Xanthomonadaceae bacterium]
MTTASLFSRMAKGVSRFSGSALCFGLAVASVLAWALTGPIFHYGGKWQAVISTGTTIITFLMVFLIQRSQNRDTEAIQIKLNELIRATHGAQNALLDVEEHEPVDLAKFRGRYTELASKAKDPGDPSVSAVGVHRVELDGMPQSDREP